MTRARAKLVIVFDYDLIPENYVDCKTVKSMIAADILIMTKEPELFFDKAKSKITIKVLKERGEL